MIFPLQIRLLAAAAVVATAAALASCSAPPSSNAALTPVVVRLDPGDIAQKISAYREAHHLDAVVVEPGLMQFAQSQANAMARADTLSHEISGSFEQRLAAANRRRSFAVENVSAGYASADSVFGGWQRSPAHNDNLLAHHVRHMGIAVADAPGTRYKTYWALVMTD